MNEIDIARRVVEESPPWGWEIPVYLFLGGVAAGVMIVSGLLALRGGSASRVVRLLSFAAPALVSVGMLSLFLDLDYKLHVLRFYTALRWSSPMSWGAWILIGVYPVTLLFGVAQLEERDAVTVRAWLSRVGLGKAFDWVRGFGVAKVRRLSQWMIALGAGLGVYTGVLLSTLAAHPLWNSSLLGLLFLASGLSTGIAFLLLFHLPENERHDLARWDKWAISLEVVLLALFIIGLVTSGEGSGAAASLILGGRYTAEFWALVVVAGLAIPFLLDSLSERMHKAMPVVAAVLVLLGGFTLRWILVSAGQA